MKKICFITTISLTMNAFIKNFIEYIHEHSDHEIYLICDDSQHMLDSWPDYAHFLPVSMERGLNFGAIKATVQMYRLFRQHRFNAVQYTTPNASLYASVAARFARIPVRLYCQWGVRYMGFTGAKRSVFKFFEKLTCRNSTYIEAESHGIYNFSLAEKLYTKNKASVTWNGSASGVDLTKFDYQQKESWRHEIREKYSFENNDLVFSFAGRLTKDKGVNELLAAFIRLQSEYKNAHLLIIGGDDNVGSIDPNLLAQAKNNSHVHFTGNIACVERYFAAADVFVAPSYREGFGLVVIEAGAMQLPAIVSNVPGQVDAILPDKTGLLCEVKDSESLYNAMKIMLSNDRLRLEFSKNARNWVENNFEQNRLFSFMWKKRKWLLGDE